MTDPQRSLRLKLAMAVATLWLLSVGGRGKGNHSRSDLFKRKITIRYSLFASLDVTQALAQAHRQRRATRLRWVSGILRGWVRVPVALLQGEPSPLPRVFKPEPWPGVPPLDLIVRDSSTGEASYANVV